MKRQHIIIFFTILVLQISFAQEPESYIKQKIVFKTEIVVEKIGNRGLITKNENVYYVEDDLQTICAYEDENKKIWQTNVIKTLGKPKVGKPIIRFIKLTEKTLQVTYGKHSFAEIDIRNGKIISSGSD
jgi:hypothetical protein